MNIFFQLIFLEILLFSFNIYSQESDYYKEHSTRVESLLSPDIEAIFKNLSPVLPQTNFIAFSRGKIYISNGNLIWRDLSGLETILVSKTWIPTGHSLSGFEISPDGKKVAFNTTEHGQDLKYWNVVEIKRSPKIFLTEPALSRMDEFRWAINSQGFYYSFWNDKEDVKEKTKPILDARYRNILSQVDETVFAPGFAENFGIAEANFGETLFAYRFLNPNSGIKTTFSLFKSYRDRYGRIGKWTKAYPRNEHVGLFLGIYDNSALILTSRLGAHYGVESIGALSGRSEVVVPSEAGKVLHMAELHENHLILQYHSVKTQNVTLVVHNLETKKNTATEIESLGLTPFGDLGRFKFGPGGTIARAVFSDVMHGDQVLELDLSTGKISRLQNIKDSEFNSEEYDSKIVEISVEDNSVLHGRLFYPRNQKPKFLFLRHYGWISVKNSPETKEVQAVLKLGGAYFTAELPGGGERGAEWFLEGSRRRLESVGYVAKISDYLQKHLGLTPDKVVAMGRSWGGTSSLILAGKYGSHFGIIAPVVPVIDLKDMFENSWFGRISHSDFAPEINGFGEYILDEKFWNYINSINPISILNQMRSGPDVYLFTSGFDDRVDQGGQKEVEFARLLESKVGPDRFMYHRSVIGNHSARYYQLLLLSLIAKKYNLTLSNQTSNISCEKYLSHQN